MPKIASVFVRIAFILLGGFFFVMYLSVMQVPAVAVIGVAEALATSVSLILDLRKTEGAVTVVADVLSFLLCIPVACLAGFWILWLCGLRIIPPLQR